MGDAFLAMKTNSVFITIKATSGCQIAAELPVAASDSVVVKKRFSAFFGTNLEELLSSLQPDTLIIAGINTHACIRMTAIDAYQRDWPVVIAGDCVGSWDDEHHAVTLRYLQREIARVMSNERIALELRA